MTLICNTVVRDVEAKLDTATTTGEESWEVHFNKSERHIESGSAYFAQAFIEALNLISDIELHNPGGAGLRLQSMTFLLEHALKQYDISMKLGSSTGLNEYHERKLRKAGLDFEGISYVLNEAQSRKFLKENNELVRTIATTFNEKGYLGVMNLYLERVQEIYNLTVTLSTSEKPKNDSVIWQELGWKFTTLFTQTLEIGKAIAILNTLTFRLPSDALASSKR